MIRKFARFEVIAAAIARPGVAHVRTAHRANFDYVPKVGYLYVRSRAISSRCNDNFDEFPAADIKAAYATFIGKPVFVNHNNSNHRRARGVIVDAALHEDVNPDGTPDTWAEVLMEVDAVRFPKLAQAIIAGDVARTSMGCDVEFSVCSYCGNKARTPLEYCGHIPALKGQRIRRRTASGDGNEDVLVSEICHGLLFFENSLLVEPPADPTAYFLGVDTRGLQTTAAMLGKMAVTVDDVDYDPHGAPNLFPGEQAHWPPEPPDALDPRKKPADLADPDDGFADLDSLNHDILERAERGQQRVMHDSTRRLAALRVVSDADESVVVPAEVDTLRDIKCPAGFNENDSACGFDGSECAVCGYIKPIEDFDDPDTSKAKELDRDKAIDATEDEIEEQEEETDMADQQPRSSQRLSTVQQVRALRSAFVEQGRLYAEAIAARDEKIAAQDRSIAALGKAVEFLAAKGGHTASLMVHLGMRTQADINNPAQPVPEPPAEPASTTTEQEMNAATPVDLFAPGAVPGATDVISPDADLFGIGGDMAAPPPADVEDVQAPVAGTGAGEVPLADVRTETEIETGPSPAQVPVFTGNRTMASIHLARLRQEANVADPAENDLVIASTIEASDMTDAAMTAEIGTLTAVCTAQRRNVQRTAVANGRRDLVPRVAHSDGSRATPSLAPAGVGASTGGGEFSDDESMFLD